MSTHPRDNAGIRTGMSIAVSALIVPSRYVFSLVSLLTATTALLSVMVGFGLIGELWPLVGATIGGLGFVASVASWRQYRTAARPWRLSISGAGQLSMALPDSRANGLLAVQLLHGSTLWANLLLLRFQLSNGQVKSVVILPDCVPENVFRQLSVACRWIASRGDVKRQKKVMYEQAND